MTLLTPQRHAHAHSPTRSPRSAWIGLGLGAVIIAALFLVDAFLPSLFPGSRPARKTV